MIIWLNKIFLCGKMMFQSKNSKSMNLIAYCYGDIVGWIYIYVEKNYYTYCSHLVHSVRPIKRSRRQHGGT